MTSFTTSGDAFIPTARRESMLDGLPVGNFIAVIPQQGPPHFKRDEPFGDPGRMYGNINVRAQRILDTFLDRPRTTGVLLAGEKGSGKSQLARNVSRLAYEKDIPTILVNAPLIGDAFNSLIASIDGPAIVMMDEFEKVYYEKEWQEQILTLLDGVITSQKLFILTVNDKYKVNQHMLGRPGRLYYSYDFSGLEPEFIREYCEANLENQDNLESVMTMSAMFFAFNFDMLKATVEEMNRYGETAFEVIEHLNVKPLPVGAGAKFDVVVIAKNGVKSHPVELEQIPLSGGTGHGRNNDVVSFYAKFDGAPQWDGDEKTGDKFDLQLAAWEKELLDVAPGRGGSVHSDGQVYVTVESSGLKKVDVDAGRYQFIATNGATVEFAKKKSEATYHPGAW